MFAHGVTLIVFARMGFDNKILFLLSYYALTILAAKISFRIFEAWFQSLRHKPMGRISAG